MDLLNSTSMAAGYTMGMDPEGREYLLVAVKGTFSLPLDGREARLMEDQMPLVEADTFTGEPGFSAPVHECDYALRKKRCDVILNGSAYAPKERPATKVPVGLKVGNMEKTFNVVGNRVWESPTYSIGRSPTEKFLKMPITYDRAFGGIDDFHPDETKRSAYMINPVGTGYHEYSDSGLVDGTPLPNTEEIKKSVKMPNGNYRPMAFGVIGRNWEPRYRYGGTYDKKWLDDVFPFLPADFDDAYYQCSPADQQIEYLKGGEEVFLVNLTSQGKTRFQIPQMEVPVVFFLKKGEPYKTQAVADTLVLEPDESRFMITWRASLPLKKNMFEVAQVLTGKMSRGWWRARELGKTYYRSLEELRVSKRSEAEEEG